MRSPDSRTGFVAVIALVLSLPLLGGTGEKELPPKAKAILSKATEFTLVSLEPSDKPGKGDKDGTLHGWKVLGVTKVKDAATRDKLVGILEKNLADPKPAKCFDPRHAIQAEHDGKTVDLVICFECGRVHVYLNGKDADRLEMSTAGQPAFDEVLRKAKVPLSKGPKE